MRPKGLYVVMAKPPGPEGDFVELENEAGRSVGPKSGDGAPGWIEEPPYWLLGPFPHRWTVNEPGDKHLEIAFYPEVRGGHTHVRIFMGPSEASRGLAGELVFRNEEWEVFEKRIVDLTHDGAISTIVVWPLAEPLNTITGRGHGDGID